MAMFFAVLSVGNKFLSSRKNNRKEKKTTKNAIVIDSLWLYEGGFLVLFLVKNIMIQWSLKNL